MATLAVTSWAAALAHVGGWLHRRFLAVLLACYVLAACFPQPGLALRHASVALPTGQSQHVPMLLLALLLFCAALSMGWEQVRDVLERPSVTASALAVVWLGPLLVVGAACAALSRWTSAESLSGLLVGLALVAAMPVANSSAGWSQSAGGNVALSLGLVVLSIVLCPLATPQVLRGMGLALSAGDTEKIERLVAEFSGARFIVWVIFPSLAGACAAWLLGAARAAALRPWLRLVTLVDLLLLNYANAALALPKVLREEPWRSTGAAAWLGLSVSLLGVGLAIVLGRALRVARDGRIALLFGLSMKHTGLALVLAGEVLSDQPRVILVIVLATLAQHVVAAAIDASLARGGSRAAAAGPISAAANEPAERPGKPRP
jgi:BASS family bile acid:Na+ symporter